MNSAVMETYNRLPVAFESGQGVWLFDEEGNQYLDALAGLAVCALGHAHPAIQQAIADQAGRLIHTSNLYQVPLQEKLAGELCRVSGLDRVFFNNSGAEANETAIKLCRKYGHDRGLKKPVIIVMQGAFHGRTLATLTATDNRRQQPLFAPLPEGFHRVPYNDVQALRETAELDMPVAAVMLEPIQGEGGVIIPEPGYLQQVAAVCAEQDWLLVLDEVQTGMCRTGEWFAFQHEGIRPDVITLAKSLANGVPIGACLVNERVAGTLTPGTHGSTFGGNPLAARAGLAVLQTMQEHRLSTHAAAIGRRLLTGFQATLGQAPGVRDIRGRGLMLGIELDQDCAELVTLALQRRLLINVTRGNVVRLLPPLLLSESEADQILSGLSDLILDFLAGRT